MRGAWKSWETGDCSHFQSGALESLETVLLMRLHARKTGCDIPLNRKTAGRCRDFLSRLHNDEHGAIQIPLTRRGRRGGTGNAVHASENQRGFTVLEASDTVCYVVDPDGKVLPFQFDKDSARIWCEKSNASTRATVGSSLSKNYKKTFFDAHPHLEGKVVVHHGVEQQVLKKYPGRFTEAEIHSLENLRGIPKSINSDVHLSKIRKAWNRFYDANPNATRQQILDEATRIDRLFGSQFDPPL